MDHNIDLLEQELLENFKEIKEIQATLDAEEVVLAYVQNDDLALYLADIYNDSAEGKKELKENHDMVKKAQKVYEAKGNQTSPEIQQFLERVRTLSNEDYNDVTAFEMKVFFKDTLDSFSGNAVNPTLDNN